MPVLNFTAGTAETLAKLGASCVATRRPAAEPAGSRPTRPGCSRERAPRASLKPAPIPVAARDGCSSGGAARRRSLKADGTARPACTAARVEAGGRARAGRPRQRSGEPPPPDSAGSGDARAGLDHAPSSCARRWRRRRRPEAAGWATGWCASKGSASSWLPGHWGCNGAARCCPWSFTTPKR